MSDMHGFVLDSWRERLHWESLPDELKTEIANYGYYMYRLGKHTVGDIDQVKYDGRLVILDDGSRWEVDSIDANTVDYWSPGAKVAIIDDVMYNLDDAEHADVSEE
ncbi:hypothetical protein MPRF_04890 [Mycolicibacterium parafortuitum]|uniref:Uncharacterized protein n=1 Tax=Mycolicibacterium parafortuitum TaxID=39692 RepID=A0A7I7TWU8_MYCPF|nr:hypothetical protein [Mycolicibacterium parafortuitum]BBY73590.1 hypothetical protein MPRF_04890 [Mycolicibacterium parafortuitum]